MAQSRNTVMIVDDHPLFRQGLRQMLEEHGRFKVVAEATTGYEAIRLADIHKPHLMLSDIQLPGVSGLKIARILKKQHPNSQVVLLTMHLDDERLFDAVQAGVSAYLTKDMQAHDLVGAITRVANGEQPINALVLSRPQLARRVLNEFRSLNDGSPNGDKPASRRSRQMLLSVREIEVLDCVAQGLSNKEIADVLFITEQTVKNHMTSVLRKLEVTDRVQAVLYAVKHGWIEVNRGPSPAVVWTHGPLSEERAAHESPAQTVPVS